MANDEVGQARSSEAFQLLNAVADGTISADTAISRWPFDADDPRPNVAPALHALHHYAADGDIRARDPGYAAQTAAELRLLAERLVLGEVAIFRSFGPRTDVRYMTRAELFRSAGQFLVGGAVFVALWFLAAFTMSRLLDSPAWAPAVMFLSFLITIAVGMCLLAGAYLAVRGLFRSSSYDPRAIQLSDLAKWEGKEDIERQDGPPPGRG